MRGSELIDDDSPMRPRRLKSPRHSTAPERRVKEREIRFIDQKYLGFGSDKLRPAKHRPACTVRVLPGGTHVAVFPGTSKGHGSSILFFVLRSDGFNYYPTDIFWIPPEPRAANSRLCLVHEVVPLSAAPALLPLLALIRDGSDIATTLRERFAAATRLAGI